MSLPVDPPTVKCPGCGDTFKIDGMRVAGELTSKENQELAQAFVNKMRWLCAECKAKPKEYEVRRKGQVRPQFAELEKDSDLVAYDGHSYEHGFGVTGYYSDDFGPAYIQFSHNTDPDQSIEVIQEICFDLPVAKKLHQMLGEAIEDIEEGKT